MSDIAKNPGIFLHAMEQMLDGLQNKVPAGMNQLAVGGKVFTINELVTEVQGYASVYQVADDAAKEHEKANIARDNLAPLASARYAEIRAALKSAIGKKSPDLQSFGIKPDQAPAPLTTEQKTLMVERARATRVARHTMGPRQKKNIKGQVPAPPPEK